MPPYRNACSELYAFGVSHATQQNENRIGGTEVVRCSREGRLDYGLVESTAVLEPLVLAAPRRGRRTALIFPLLPPPQKS
jgi:hypothetical protein